MAKRAKKEEAADFPAVSAKVGSMLARGEIRASALLIKEAKLSEEDFDAILEGRPELRAVYLSL